MKRLILRRRQTPSFRAGSKAPLSINPEPSTRAQAEGHPPGACPERSRRVRPGKAEGLICIGLFLWFIVTPPHVFSEVALRMVGPEDIGGAWAEIIRRFQEKNPGIRIEYTSGPSRGDG